MERETSSDRFQNRTKPKVSIVIPAYNAEETLDDCLRAVLNQEDYEIGEDYEVIVVNDASTDRTKEIVSGYNSVRLIDLDVNSGRIVARKAGVAAARHDTVFLVDARIIVSSEALKVSGSVGYSPLMSGDCSHDKYRSRYDTLFYLLRRVYYRPYFPLTEYGTEMWITPENFARAPKGMGCVLIDKELFLDVLPEKQDKTVNDDTKIFERIVVERGIKVLGTTDLKVEYRQRVGPDSLRKWLFERGVRFADYWLLKKPMYLWALLLSYGILAGTVTTLLITPNLFWFVAAALIAAYFAVALAISEERQDWLPVLSSLYIVILHFWLGVSWGLLLKLGSLPLAPANEE